MLFYYLTGDKTRDVFLNSRPIASLRLENTWGGLILVDLLKIMLHHIFQDFCNRLTLGGLIYGTTFVLVFWWAYIRGARIWSSTALKTSSLSNLVPLGKRWKPISTSTVTAKLHKHSFADVKIGFLKNFENLIGLHLCQSLFNKVAGLQLY